MNLNKRVEGYLNGLLDSLKAGRYINDRLKNQLLSQAFGILDVGVESIKSSTRARLDYFGYTGSLANEILSAVERRVPSIRADLTNKAEVKILKLNEEYKGYIKIWMEHPFVGEVIKVIVMVVIPVLLAILGGSYFFCEIKRFALKLIGR